MFPLQDQSIVFQCVSAHLSSGGSLPQAMSTEERMDLKITFPFQPNHRDVLPEIADVLL